MGAVFWPDKHSIGEHIYDEATSAEELQEPSSNQQRVPEDQSLPCRSKNPDLGFICVVFSCHITQIPELFAI